MAITWTLPANGQSYTVRENNQVSIQFTGSISDKTYNAYRFRLVSNNANIRFSDYTQTGYTEELDNDDTFSTTVSVTGVIVGTSELTVVLQGLSGTTWQTLAYPAHRTLHVTVTQGPRPVVCQVKVYHNNAWVSATPYVYQDNAWHQATQYVYRQS